MRKNFLLRKYHYIHSAVEIIFPTLLFVILVTINNSSSNPNQNDNDKDNQVPPGIPSMSLYPIEFCDSLEDILGNEENHAGAENKVLLTREFYYTNVPDNEDASNVAASALAKDIIETVVNTINDVLVPCCRLFLANKNITIHGEGILRELFVYTYS